ncbi:MAG: sigma factor-like helix-turn-helix DNA-binding protein [Pseudomonadota bacterium]
MRKAIETLPAEQDDIIEHCYMGGLSQSEAAERLGMPIGTVKSRLRLA